MVWWILLCLLPLAAAVTVLARPGQPSRWSAQTRIAVFTVAAGLLVPLGGLVSGAFKPVSDAEVPNVSAETSIVGHRKAADGSPLAVVEADVTLENIGKRRLVVIGSVYTVFGAQSRGRVLKPPVPWAYAAEMASTSWSGRSEEPYVTHAVEMGYDVVTPGNTLDPGQRIVVRILTPVPAAEDNTAGIDVSVATAFADRLRLGDQLEDPNDGTMSATHAVTAVWNVEPTSWVARLTRGRSVVAMDYQVSPMSDWPVSGSTAVPDDPHSVYGTYRVGLDEQTLQRADRYNAKPETFYGTAWTGAESTVAVDGGGK
jgi:hypothetical protein